MKNFLLLPIFLLALLQLRISFAQTNFNNSTLAFERWQSTYGGSVDTFNHSFMISDSQGDVVEIGNTMNGVSCDMLITKIISSSSTIGWSVQWDGPDELKDYGVALTVDGSDNIYAAGATEKADGYDWVIMKIDGLYGTILWTQYYQGSASTNFYNIPVAMTFDVAGTGALFVTGLSTNSSYNRDYSTLRINAGTGAIVWTSIYNYSGYEDVPGAIDISGTAVIVTGGSGNNIVDADYATVRYRTSSGSQTSSSRTSSGGLGFDQATSICRDMDENYVITGMSRGIYNEWNILTVKLDTQLNEIWSELWGEGNYLDDAGMSVKVDAEGNYVVAGYTSKSNGGRDFVVLKYEIDGDLAWDETVAAPDETKIAQARMLDITDNGLILVTGTCFNIGSNDILTVCFDADGNRKFENWYNGKGDDISLFVKADGSNSFYVTGKTWVDTSYEYVTMRFEIIDYITPPDTEVCPVSFAYYENKGQIWSTDSTAVPQVKFYTEQHYPDLYLMDDTISYVFARVDTSASTLDTLQRISMTFYEGNGTKACHNSPRSGAYLNYFKPWCAKGITSFGFQQIEYPDVYDGIDLMCYGNGAGMKMYWVCDAGSYPHSITMQFGGADDVYVDGEGRLRIVSSIGSTSYAQPIAYQIDESGNYVALSWQPEYEYAGNGRFGFSLDTYDAGRPIVFEMEEGPQPPPPNGNNIPPDWCTYYGHGSDSFDAIVTDNKGETYLCGTAGNSLFPIFNAIDPNFNGEEEAVVVHFDTLGVREWATFYGGGVITTGFGNDHGEGIAVDKLGNVIFTGHTSCFDFPTFPSSAAGAYNQPTMYGSNDAFIVKLTNDGAFQIWATWFGGDGTENGNDITTDNFDNIIVTGSGDGNTPTFTYSGAYNDSIGRGFIAKFSPLGVPIWGSNLGTNAGTLVLPWSVKTDFDDNLYICGYLAGNVLPIVNPGADSTFEATHDGFIMKFNSSDYSIAWSTYYGGSQTDWLFACDISGDFSSPQKLLVTGTSSSADSTLLLPSFGSYYHDSTGPGVIILQFDCSGGQLEWGTFYGSGWGRAIHFDDADRFLVSGPTGSIYFPIISNNPSDIYVQDTLRGGQDAFILFFDNDRQPVWTTFFGGSGNFDQGYGLATHGSTVYLTGSTNSPTQFPLQPFGSAYYQDTYYNYGVGYIARFDVSSVVGIPEVENSTSHLFQIFPNPNSGIFYLQCNEELNTAVINIFDCLGQNHFHSTIEKINSPYLIDVSKLPAGMYLLQISSGGNSYVQKIIIQ